MKKIKELVLPINIILNILYVFIGSYLFTIQKISYETFSYGYIVLLTLNIIVFITFLILKGIKKENFNIIDIFLILITIFNIISWIFAIKPKVALFGITSRYEGLFQITYYLTLMFLCTFIDKDYKKLIIFFILGTGAIQSMYAVFQVTKIVNVVRMYHFSMIWATGFITNPNFLCTYMLLCLSYSLGLYFDEESKILKIGFLLLIFVFMSGLLITNTLSGIVGLLFIMLYIFIFSIKSKKYKKLILSILVILLTIAMFHFAGRTKLIKEFIKTSNETKEMVKGNISDEQGSFRIYIWKNTLKVVPQNIIHGVGIDNFAYAFGKEPLYLGMWIFDKVHNEYLQILVCQGIFCLISYLGLYFIIVKRAIKNSFKNKELYLILPVIGYLVQAFFNISVIEVAPIFYISLGLLVDRNT